MNLIEFKNKPDTTTPINKTNLNHNFKEIKEKIEETDKNISDIDEKNVYSTEEKVIGIWKDGKPIYRKVIEFTTEIVSGDNVIYISTPNIDKLVRSVFSQKGQNYLFPHFTTAGKFTFLQYVTYNYINIRSNDTWSNNTWELILEYTKTTD